MLRNGTEVKNERKKTPVNSDNSLLNSGRVSQFQVKLLSGAAKFFPFKFLLSGVGLLSIKNTVSCVVSWLSNVFIELLYKLKLIDMFVCYTVIYSSLLYLLNRLVSKYCRLQLT